MKMRILPLCIFLFISGCSLINSYSDNLSQDIRQWIKEKKYNVALNTINYINPTHKNYRVIQRQKKVILKKMARYEKNAIKKSTRLSNQGRWIKAFKLLDKVTENLVDTKKIKKHRAKLLIKRNKIITTYENKVLHRQAKHLASDMKLYKKIKKTVSESESNKLNIYGFDEQRKETNLKLIKLSKLQYKKRQYNKALTTIKLALKLNSNKKTRLFRNKIKKHIKKKTRKPKKTSKTNKKSNIKEVKILLSKLSQGYSYDILQETRETIVWLKKINEGEKVYLNLIKKLNKHLTAGIKQYFEAARKLYIEGDFQEALNIWLDLKKLEPKYPKLQSHIDRAQKVLLKFNKLSNKPKAVGG